MSAWLKYPQMFHPSLIKLIVKSDWKTEDGGKRVNKEQFEASLEKLL